MKVINNTFDTLLEKHRLKKTAPRYRVLEILTTRDVATSQPYLEELLGAEVDRVTLYRILKTFEEKGIIHKIIDVNGTANYAVCHSTCTEKKHHDEHVHFNCTSCNGIYCFNENHIAKIRLPKGFKTSSVSLIITGICAKCSTEAANS